jgi:ketosteroid isomerase-like protein
MNDKAEIQDLINRYTYSVNVRDWAAIASVFSTDARWELVGNPQMKFEGPGLGAGLRSIIEPNSSLIQMNTPALIEVRGDRATASSTMHEAGDIKTENKYFSMYGIYNDELAKASGRWLFVSRRFTILNLRITPLNV